MRLACWLVALVASSAAAQDGRLHPLCRIERADKRHCVQQTVAAALDPLRIVGTLPETAFGMAFGDTDHDGAHEVWLGSVGGPGGAKIFEYSAATQQWIPAGTVAEVDPFSVGDLDQDGKADLLGAWGGALRVFEAPDEHSFPSILVWESPPLSATVGYPTIADTDGDHQQEIISSINSGGSRLVIYECIGDNSYQQKYLGAREGQDVGRKVIGDLDRNGRTDIATCGTRGQLRIVEGQANDTWAIVFSDATGMYNAYAISGGADTDADGEPELFVSGDIGEVRQTMIYQPKAGSYGRIATLTVEENSTGEVNGLAQLEPGGPTKLLWLQVVPLRLQFYGSPHPGQWALESEFVDPAGQHSDVFTHDVNRNGRAEIYWMGGTSWILERPTTTSDSPGRRIPEPKAHLTIQPTPSRTFATVQLDAEVAARAQRWSLYDVGGRRLFTSPTNARVSLPFDVQTLRPGLYFVRVEDHTGVTLSSGRTVVVRASP